MKKLFLLLLGIFFCAFSLMAFGKRDVECVAGYINYYGNAPFAFPGFEAVDGRVFALKVKKGSSFTVKDIALKKGSLLELTGKIDTSALNGPDVLSDGVFVVSKWKVISE